jgi:hypothetical protein
MKHAGYLFLLLNFFSLSCNKKSEQPINKSPVASLIAELISANPFTFKFSVTAQDPELDPLSLPGILAKAPVVEEILLKHLLIPQTTPIQ